MKKIATNRSGELIRSEVIYFGGSFSFFEKLLKNGVGSPRVIYDKGIIDFDTLKRDVEGEITYVNFELLKNGLILRANCNQRIQCIGVRLDQIKVIQLTAFRIEIRHRRFGQLVTKIVHRGELEVIERDGQTSDFSILAKEFKALKTYFRRSEFSSKFKFIQSDNPPENDFGYLADYLDGIL